MLNTVSKTKFSAIGLVSLTGMAIYLYKIFRRSSILKVTSKQAVLITGCDSGLGYSFARHCNELGITVFSCVHNETSFGAMDLKTKENIHLMKLDVTDKESIKNLQIQTNQILNSMNYDFLGIVNNAGIMVFGEFEWLTEEQIENQIKVNFLGTAHLTKEFLPLLRKFKGRIINVSSHCSKVPLPALSIYGASKAAIDGWSSVIRMELEKFGIKVITFTPGSYITQSNIMANQEKHKEKMKECMPAETMELYSDYFNRFNDYLKSIPRQEGLIYIQDENLMKKFDHALLSHYPQASYVNAPFRYQFYHFFINISPCLFLRNYFIRKYVKLPEW